MDDKAEKIALFRYGLIAPLVLETLPRGELTRRAQELAARLYDIPHSARRQVSVDTLLDWTLRYPRFVTGSPDSGVFGLGKRQGPYLQSGFSKSRCSADLPS
jgi:hypothetical protein